MHVILCGPGRQDASAARTWLSASGSTSTLPPTDADKSNQTPMAIVQGTCPHRGGDLASFRTLLAKKPGPRLSSSSMWDDGEDLGLPHTPAKAKKEEEEPVSVSKTARPAKPKLPSRPDGQGRWANVAKKWAFAAQWPPQAASSPLKHSPTWLISSDAGLGCLACQRSPKLTTTWAQVAFSNQSHLKRYFFERHSSSASHIAAVAAYLQLERGPTGRLMVGAPDLNEFQRLAELMAQGQQRQFKKGNPSATEQPSCNGASRNA